MTKITRIMCDECDADITNASHQTLTNINVYLKHISMEKHFCSFKHMYMYLDKRRPEELKVVE